MSCLGLRSVPNLKSVRSVQLGKHSWGRQGVDGWSASEVLRANAPITRAQSHDECDIMLILNLGFFGVQLALIRAAEAAGDTNWTK